MRRIVAVAGPGHVFELFIIPAPHVRVFKQDHDRRAAGLTANEPGHDPGRVGLPPACCQKRPARRAAGQEAAERLHIHREARREALDHAADRRRVGLPEYSYFQPVSKTIRHQYDPPVSHSL